MNNCKAIIVFDFLLREGREREFPVELLHADCLVFKGIRGFLYVQRIKDVLVAEYISEGGEFELRNIEYCRLVNNDEVKAIKLFSKYGFIVFMVKDKKVKTDCTGNSGEIARQIFRGVTII